MEIQYISDIHLEKGDIYYNNFPQWVTAPNSVLVLAGDIGNPSTERYKNFIKKCSENFKYVVLILGNHEYYGGTIEETEKEVQEFTLYSNFTNNVYFLQDNYIKIENTYFYGTTFWSHIPDKQRNYIEGIMNDFTKIEGFDVDTYNRLHFDKRNKLQGFLEVFGKSKKPYEKIVVVTHHAPIWLPHPKYPVENTFAFNTDMSDLITAYGPDIWIYGHTHLPDTRKIGNTVVTTNPRGYLGELSKSHILPVKTITLEQISLKKLYIALDYNNERSVIEMAHRFVKECPNPNYGFKINLDTVLAVGIDELLRYMPENRKIFLDLKMWNGSKTMSRVLQSLIWDSRIDIVNIYATAGVDFIKSVVEMRDKGEGHYKPKIFVLTVLTHYDDDYTREIYNSDMETCVKKFAEIAEMAGADGIILPATYLYAVKSSPLLKLCPGIRPEGSLNKEDMEYQKQGCGVKSAIEMGANYLVIGSPITKSKDPYKALNSILNMLNSKT